MEPTHDESAKAITMTIRFIHALLLLLGTSLASAAVDTEYMQGLGDVRYHRIESTNVERPFHIYVSLPSDYDPSASEKYPTIYILDGGALFPTLSPYYRFLNFGEGLPDAIIVGISYGSDNYGNGNYRSTDYTAPSTERTHYGGAETYQQFLAGELIPLIENTYASRSDRRILFGTSLGGQFVLFTALTKPALFWGYIANNPALHRNLPFFLQHHAKADSDREQPRLFVGDGTLNDERYRIPSQQWIKHWADRKDNPWALKTMDLEGHSHMSSSPASFRQGLHWIFSDNRAAN